MSRDRGDPIGRRLDLNVATAGDASTRLRQHRHGCSPLRPGHRPIPTARLPQGALGDLALALDPLAQGRYTLAGGNPVSFMDWDGHIVLMGTCEAADELLIIGLELVLSTYPAPSI